jgi:hypothetical protein
MLSIRIALRHYARERMTYKREHPKISTKETVTQSKKDVAEDPNLVLEGLIEIANRLPADAPVFPICDEEDFETWVNENFSGERHREFRAWLSLMTHFNTVPNAKLGTYAFGFGAKQVLRAIAASGQARLVYSGKLFPWQMLREWNIKSIKICENENCNKLFYARRKDKLTCSETCASTRRMRLYREHRRQYEHARKRKVARLKGAG